VSAKPFWNSWFKKKSVEKIEGAVSKRLRWGIVSITGNFRHNNEDRCLVDPQGRYFLVADGMGGQSAGEKASELAAELVPRRLEQLLDFRTDSPEKVATSIDDAIGHANLEIMALGQLDPNLHSMGTTVALLVAVENALYAAGIGDSRIYRLRGQELEQLTKDDSLSQALHDAGTISKEEAATHRYKHVLVRYLGSKEGSTGANVKPLTVEPGDRFLLCTDGVTDGAPDTDIAHILRTESDPQAAAEAIVAAAQRGGSKDNITCVVVYVN
jgi:protein phosphatase